MWRNYRVSKSNLGCFNVTCFLISEQEFPLTEERAEPTWNDSLDEGEDAQVVLVALLVGVDGESQLGVVRVLVVGLKRLATLYEVEHRAEVGFLNAGVFGGKTAQNRRLLTLVSVK